MIEGKGDGLLGFPLVQHGTLHAQARPNVVT